MANTSIKPISDKLKVEKKQGSFSGGGRSIENTSIKGATIVPFTTKDGKKNEHTGLRFIRDELKYRINKDNCFVISGSTYNNSLKYISKTIYKNDAQKLAYYFSAIKEVTKGKNYSDENILSWAAVLMKEDEKNGYSLAHRMPVKLYIPRHRKYYSGVETVPDLQINTSYYLRFFNEFGLSVTAPIDIVNGSSNNTTFMNNNKYIGLLSTYYHNIMYNSNNNFPKSIKNIIPKLTGLELVHLGNPKYGAYCRYTGNDSSYICIDTSEFILAKDSTVSSREPYYNYEFMVEAFEHELGHAFDHANSFFTETEEFKSIYNQVCEFDKDDIYLRKYAKDNPQELWAEIVSEYIYTDGYKETFYSKKDLMAIPVKKLDGTKITLYDYVKSILGN